VPIGAYARYEDDTLVMDAMVGSVDGTHIVREQLCGDAGEPEALGEAMVERLLRLGAGEILAEIRDADDVDGLLKT
jgi:hydroxymethylbilane synthase